MMLSIILNKRITRFVEVFMRNFPPEYLRQLWLKYTFFWNANAIHEQQQQQLSHTDINIDEEVHKLGQHTIVTVAELTIDLIVN